MFSGGDGIVQLAGVVIETGNVLAGLIVALWGVVSRTRMVTVAI